MLESGFFPSSVPFSFLMARLPRLVVPEQPHHVIQRGNDRRTIFHDDEDRTVFIKSLREAAKMYQVAVHAYVLMPNHIHLLATPADATGLAKMMQWIGRHYVPYFNRRHGRVGTLWQGRFRTSVIDTERYFLVCSRYIELNPVRADLVADPADFAWSSYRHHVGLNADPLITDHSLFWALGNTPFQREAAYRQLVEAGLEAGDIDLLRTSVSAGRPVGTPAFKSALAKRTNRAVEPGKRGRPRKPRGTTAAI